MHHKNKLFDTLTALKKQNNSNIYLIQKKINEINDLLDLLNSKLNEIKIPYYCECNSSLCKYNRIEQILKKKLGILSLKCDKCDKIIDYEKIKDSGFDTEFLNSLKRAKCYECGKCQKYFELEFIGLQIYCEGCNSLKCRKCLEDFHIGKTCKFYNSDDKVICENCETINYKEKTEHEITCFCCQNKIKE